MNGQALVKNPLTLALLAAALGTMAGCWVKTGTFNDYQAEVAKKFTEAEAKVDEELAKQKNEIDTRLDAIEKGAAATKADAAVAKTDAAAAKKDAAAAKKDAAAAKTDATAARTEAAKATKRADDAEKLVNQLVEDNKKIRALITDGLEPRLKTAEQTGNANKRRLATLDKEDLPDLKKDILDNKNQIAALGKTCEDLKKRVTRLEKGLDDETAEREKLAASLADLKKALTAETIKREENEKAQAKTNTQVQNALDRLTAGVKANLDGIRQCNRSFDKLKADTDQRLAGQDERIKTIDADFNTLLEDEKTAFTELLNNVIRRITERKLRKVTPTTKPGSKPTTRGTTGPAKPAGGPP